MSGPRRTGNAQVCSFVCSTLQLVKCRFWRKKKCHVKVYVSLCPDPAFGLRSLCLLTNIQFLLIFMKPTGCCYHHFTSVMFEQDSSDLSSELQPLISQRTQIISLQITHQFSANFHETFRNIAIVINRSNCIWVRF